MDELGGRYRFPHAGFEMRVGTDSAVLTQTYVAEALRRDKRSDDGLDAARGAINAVLISLFFWLALGLAIFTFF
jgi:hypothetical protein